MPDIPEEMKSLDEEKLRLLVQPSYNMQLIRHTFWAEVRFAYFNNRAVLIENVFNGIMNRSSFIKNLTLPIAAYILCPTYEHAVKLEQAHELAMQSVVAILATPRSSDPKVDYNYDRLKLEIFKFLDDKRHGAAVQKQLNINHELKANGKDDTATVDEIKKQFESGGIIEVDT